MREDFNKLLCERERRGSRNKFANVRNIKRFTNSKDNDEFSDLPDREGMKTRHNYNYRRKEFNENLNPLKGFLNARVGKKWDKVYSEICATFDKRSVINQHILVHLFDYVNNEVWMDENRKLFETNLYSYRGPREVPFANNFQSKYFVDPRDGILKKNPNYQTWAQRSRILNDQRIVEQANLVRTIDDQNKLEKIDDIWYRVTSTPYIYFEKRFTGYDESKVNENGIPIRIPIYENRPVTRYKVTKKQLNGKEIKQYGVDKEYTMKDLKRDRKR